MPTKAEKLSSLATSGTTGAGKFHIEPLPKLAELSNGYGFKRGQEMFDEAMERWRINLEKSINKALAGNATSDSTG